MLEKVVHLHGQKCECSPQVEWNKDKASGGRTNWLLKWS